MLVSVVGKEVKNIRKWTIYCGSFAAAKVKNRNLEKGSTNKTPRLGETSNLFEKKKYGGCRKSYKMLNKIKRSRGSKVEKL